jgi:hypothetical protein
MSNRPGSVVSGEGQCFRHACPTRKTECQ